MMQGYALLCVGFPSSDLEVETQDEDEVIQEKFIHHLSVYYKSWGELMIWFKYGFHWVFGPSMSILSAFFHENVFLALYQWPFVI